MCALQPENRLWLLLLSTVYVENIETICELCVWSFFTTDASNWHLWQQGAQRWLIIFGLGVYLTARLIGRCLLVQPMASPSRGVQGRA